MTRQLEVSILAAPLAAIDRRGLSQAWYSALRLARDERSAPRRRITAARDAPARERATSELKTPQDFRIYVHGRTLLSAESFATARCDSGSGFVERRARSLPLAARIETVMFDPRSKVKRASFTIGRGRVHVVVHSKGDRVALIALCPPQLREIVARALAQARFAFAARGIRSQLAARGAKGCS